jgi:hypothetical protein
LLPLKPYLRAGTFFNSYSLPGTRPHRKTAWPGTENGRKDWTRKRSSGRLWPGAKNRERNLDCRQSRPSPDLRLPILRQRSVQVDDVRLKSSAAPPLSLSLSILHSPVLSILNRFTPQPSCRVARVPQHTDNDDPKFLKQHHRVHDTCASNPRAAQQRVHPQVLCTAHSSGRPQSASWRLVQNACGDYPPSGLTHQLTDITPGARGSLGPVLYSTTAAAVAISTRYSTPRIWVAR